MYVELWCYKVGYSHLLDWMGQKSSDIIRYSAAYSANNNIPSFILLFKFHCLKVSCDQELFFFDVFAQFSSKLGTGTNLGSNHSLYNFREDDQLFLSEIVVDPGIEVKVLVSGASPGLPDFSESSVEEGLSIPV